MKLVFSTKPKTKNPPILMDTIHDPVPIIKEQYIFDQFKKDPLPKNLFVPPSQNNIQIGMLSRLVTNNSKGCGSCGKNVV